MGNVQGGHMTLYYYDSDADTVVPVSVEKSQIKDEKELEFIYDETVRKAWYAKKEEWYFSVIDVVQVLTSSDNPKNYWNMLKSRLKGEGNETYTSCVRLKMNAADGKMRKTDCATTEQLLRIIQAIPSPKAEPFKQWLAQVGAERLDEIADPEKAVNRAVSYYQRKGYSEAWITQRMRSIEIRKEMTDEWKRAGVSTPPEYAALTNVLTHTWSGKSVQEYKALKGLKKENLRDNMTNTELVLNQLAEISTTELSRSINPKGYSETENVTAAGGTVAANARKELEGLLGRSIISSLNATSPILLDDTKKK